MLVVRRCGGVVLAGVCVCVWRANSRKYSNMDPTRPQIVVVVVVVVWMGKKVCFVISGAGGVLRCCLESETTFTLLQVVAQLYSIAF